MFHVKHSHALSPALDLDDSGGDIESPILAVRRHHDIAGAQPGKGGARSSDLIGGSAALECQEHSARSNQRHAPASKFVQGCDGPSGDDVVPRRHILGT